MVNSVTKTIVNDLKTRLRFANNHSVDCATRWIDDSTKSSPAYETKYRQEDGQKRIEYDYGFLARVRNPRAQQHRILICSGNHGAGTCACMKLLASPELLAEVFDKTGSDDFQAVVGIECGGSYELGDPIIQELVKI